MTNLSRVPPHTTIFIDSNIFLYFLLKDEKYFETCQNFLSRVETGEIIGFTDHLVVSEVIFLYLKSHLVAKHKLKLGQFSLFAKARPEEVAKIDISICLKLFSTETLRIIEPPQHILLEYLPKLHLYGLLPNDTHHLLSMGYLNINDIATNDFDFERIPKLSIWKP